MTSIQKIICQDPDILDGIPCFLGTRVSLRTLMDYLKAGDWVDDFLADFPSVTREQVSTVLEETIRCTDPEGGLPDSHHD